MSAREHVPSWLRKGMTKRINSAVFSHLVDSKHQIKVDYAFYVVYRVPINLPKDARLRRSYRYQLNKTGPICTFTVSTLAHNTWSTHSLCTFLSQIAHFHFQPLSSILSLHR
ncbi:unnamed protein product [Heterobilharzia americana]|nr:unnamed protein product [Heterobilharzia americana]